MTCIEKLGACGNDLAWQWENSGGQHSREMETFQLYFYGTTQRAQVFKWILGMAEIVVLGSPTLIMDSMKQQFSRNPEAAFQEIRAAQNHNQWGARERYDAAKTECGVETFISYWCGASYAANNVGGLQVDIDWQIENNPVSVVNAWQWWEHAKNHGMDIDSQIAAAWSFFSGQRHNEGVLARYRASYRDDRSGLFDFVKSRIDALDGFSRARAVVEAEREAREARADAIAVRYGM